MLENIHNPQAHGSEWDALVSEMAATGIGGDVSGEELEFNQRFHGASFQEPIDNVQVVNEVLTTLVLGTPRSKVLPSEMILRPITVNNWNFQWTSHGIEHMVQHDTERAMRARIGQDDVAISTASDTLRRHGWQRLADLDELANDTQGAMYRRKIAAGARDIVELDIELRKATLLTTSGTYDTGNSRAIAGGDEWDAGGDSKDDIQAMATAIADDLGVSIDEISVFLSMESYNAALQDADFVTFKKNQFQGRANDFPTMRSENLAALQLYWGVGRVWMANLRKAGTDGAVTSAYGDVAILYYDGSLNAQAWDTEYGEYVFGVDFRWNKGIASTPYAIPGRTSIAYPWHAYSKPKITNNKAGALLTNCAA